MIPEEESKRERKRETESKRERKRETAGKREREREIINEGDDYYERESNDYKRSTKVSKND